MMIGKNNLEEFMNKNDLTSSRKDSFN